MAASLAILAAGVGKIGNDFLLMMQSEVAELSEGGGSGRGGSSAMPHKRNPIASENLCGLARVMRAYASAAAENTPLWHERDISHSSVERMIAPDATTTLGYMLERAAALVDGLVVYPEALQRNLDHTGGLFYSEAVLLALVGRGFPRQRAYEIVQRSAMRAIAGEGRFRDLLGADEEVSAQLSADDLDRCFDLRHALAHTGAIIDRAIQEG